jgi:hypothetical protein
MLSSSHAQVAALRRPGAAERPAGAALRRCVRNAACAFERAAKLTLRRLRRPGGPTRAPQRESCRS